MLAPASCIKSAPRALCLLALLASQPRPLVRLPTAGSAWGGSHPCPPPEPVQTSEAPPDPGAASVEQLRRFLQQAGWAPEAAAALPDRGSLVGAARAARCARGWVRGLNLKHASGYHTVAASAGRAGARCRATRIHTGPLFSSLSVPWPCASRSPPHLTPTHPHPRNLPLTACPALPALPLPAGAPGRWSASWPARGRRRCCACRASAPTPPCSGPPTGAAPWRCTPTSAAQARGPGTRCWASLAAAGPACAAWHGMASPTHGGSLACCARVATFAAAPAAAEGHRDVSSPGPSGSIGCGASRA